MDEMISKVAVRQAAEESLVAVFHLLGPTADEQAMAETGLKNLDRISPVCDWGNSTPDSLAIRAREEWNRIMGEQAWYEEKYC